MRIVHLLVLVCYLLVCPTLSYADDQIFTEWYNSLYTSAIKAEQDSKAKKTAVWGGIASKCQLGKQDITKTSTQPVSDGLWVPNPGQSGAAFDSGMGFFATKTQAAQIKYGSDPTKNPKGPAYYTPSPGEIGSISFEDQLNAATFDAVTTDNQAKADFLRRGELLVKHPLAVPVNLAVWCVAEAAQEQIPMFCTNAVKLFGMLIILEWVWMSIQWILAQAEVGQILDALVTKFHLWGFVGAFLITGYYGFTNDSWMYSIFNSFNQVGQTLVVNILSDMQSNTPTGPHNEVVSASNLSSWTAVTGNPNTTEVAGEILSPGSYFAMGILVLTSCWSKVAFGFDIVSLLIIPVLLFVTPIILATFSKMVADMALTMLEGYLGLGIAMILMALGGARWGKDYIQKVLLYGVMMGFKLLTMYTLFAIAVRMMAYIALSLHYIQGAGDFLSAIFSLLGIIMLMSFLFHRLPGAAGALFGGSPIMTFGALVKDTLDNVEGGYKALAVPAKVGMKVAGAVGKYSGAKKAIMAKTKGAQGGGKEEGAHTKPPSEGEGGEKQHKEGGAKKEGEDITKKEGEALKKETESNNKQSEEQKKDGEAAKKDGEANKKEADDKNKKEGEDKDKDKGNSAKDAAKNAGFGAMEKFKDMLGDDPSTGNFIMPDVNPPGDD